MFFFLLSDLRKKCKGKQCIFYFTSFLRNKIIANNLKEPYARLWPKLVLQSLSNYHFTVRFIS